MKKILLLTCMLLLTIGSTAGKDKSKDPVHIVSTRMDVFYFKVDKAFLGAQLEIYSAEGVQLHSEKITRRKVLIDFYYEDAGKFIICFTKEGVKREFNFIKDKPCLEARNAGPSIKIEQGV